MWFFSVCQASFISAYNYKGIKTFVGSILVLLIPVLFFM